MRSEFPIIFVIYIDNGDPYNRIGISDLRYGTAIGAKEYEYFVFFSSFFVITAKHPAPRQKIIYLCAEVGRAVLLDI